MSLGVFSLLITKTESFSIGSKYLTSAAEVFKIIPVFKQDTQLQKDVNEVLVLHQNNLSTLVPEPYFDENNLKNYLDIL